MYVCSRQHMRKWRRRPFCGGWLCIVYVTYYTYVFANRCARPSTLLRICTLSQQRAHDDAVLTYQYKLYPEAEIVIRHAIRRLALMQLRVIPCCGKNWLHFTARKRWRWYTYIWCCTSFKSLDGSADCRPFLSFFARLSCRTDNGTANLLRKIE